MHFAKKSMSMNRGSYETRLQGLRVNGPFSSDIKTIPCPINYLTYYQPYTAALLFQGSTDISTRSGRAILETVRGTVPVST